MPSLSKHGEGAETVEKHVLKYSEAVEKIIVRLDMDPGS